MKESGCHVALMYHCLCPSQLRTRRTPKLFCCIVIKNGCYFSVVLLLLRIVLCTPEISKQQHKYYIIFSDSLSSLHTILSKQLEHPITRQILLQYHKLATKSFNILFCWLPSHVGITGNEKADKAAKSALNKPIFRIPVPFTDLKPIINKYIRNQWQQDWNSQTQNKLQQIFPIIPPQSTLPSSFNEKIKVYIIDCALVTLV